MEIISVELMISPPPRTGAGFFPCLGPKCSDLTEIQDDRKKTQDTVVSKLCKSRHPTTLSFTARKPKPNAPSSNTALRKLHSPTDYHRNTIGASATVTTILFRHHGRVNHSAFGHIDISKRTTFRRCRSPEMFRGGWECVYRLAG
jgi:hypothetical protein